MRSICGGLFQKVGDRTLFRCNHFIQVLFKHARYKVMPVFLFACQNPAQQARNGWLQPEFLGFAKLGVKSPLEAYRALERLGVLDESAIGAKNGE